MYFLLSVRMNFPKQYHIKGEARDVRCHEKSISIKIFINNSMFIQNL